MTSSAKRRCWYLDVCLVMELGTKEHNNISYKIIVMKTSHIITKIDHHIKQTLIPTEQDLQEELMKLDNECQGDDDSMAHANAYCTQTHAGRQIIDNVDIDKDERKQCHKTQAYQLQDATHNIQESFEIKTRQHSREYKDTTTRPSDDNSLAE